MPSGATAPTGANVLILGENGTGKELVAREIHRLSGRANEVFLRVDMGSLSPQLFESELFGHRRGAFTDAKQDRTGFFRAATGGTLFLDEIGNVPLHLQSKLLTALERREVVPVGAEKPEPIDVRLICATNIGQDKLADESLLRQDLLYRINTVEIRLPPLRERREDIALLLTHYATHLFPEIQLACQTPEHAADRPAEQLVLAGERARLASRGGTRRHPQRRRRVGAGRFSFRRKRKRRQNRPSTSRAWTRWNGRPSSGRWKSTRIMSAAPPKPLA